MSVWFCIPSKRAPAEVEPLLALWRRQGYRIAVFRDRAGSELAGADVRLTGGFPRYPGYAHSVNLLVAKVFIFDPEARWFVTGGDDTEPDRAHMAEEIAAQCEEHFQGTFGVMQPTGDRFAGGCIDRTCGSPWMGRDFCRRVNRGQGPLWHEYTHMFVDEELQNVAVRLGILWQRPDLIHLHHHFMRASVSLDSPAVSKRIPEFLKEANSPAHWAKYSALFRERKASGFPGSEVLDAAVPA